MESYPCIHSVININTGIIQSMDGDEIYTLLKNEGHSDEHFEGYADFTHPTAEELFEREQIQIRLEEEYENAQQEREEEAQKVIADKFKMLTHIENLKK